MSILSKNSLGAFALSVMFWLALPVQAAPAHKPCIATNADEFVKCLKLVRLHRRVSPTASTTESIPLTVNFGVNSKSISRKDKKNLQEIALYLNKDSEIGTKMMIIGHADNRGNAHNNYLLSKKRAQSVRKYLIQNKVTGTRLIVRARGKDGPLVEGNSESALAANRCVEFIEL